MAARASGALVLIVAVWSLAGCQSPWLARAQSPDVERLVEEHPEPQTRYVGDVASPWGTGYAKVEGIALVTRLRGTGSDPAPSPQRDYLISEMQSHNVYKPYDVLKSPNTSLVLVRGFLPPGIEKGERFDVELRVPDRSETTSLQGGYLMQVRLRPMEQLGGSVKKGHVLALAKGSVLVDDAFRRTGDASLLKSGRVLGGGVSTVTRPLGLRIRSDMNIMTSSIVGRAINQRFYAEQQGIKQYVATPKNDRIVELVVPRQYKHNIARFIQVVRNIAMQEAPSQRAERIRWLEQQLYEPAVCAVAALRLEAIGPEAAPILKRALQVDDPKVRFCAAEALAYLGEAEAAEPLGQAALEMPAFRWHALAALAAMDDVEAGIALSRLLHADSVETRYGAFRALQARTPDDPLIAGTVLGDGFHYHAIATTGEPLIHFSSVRRPELVVFGIDQQVDTSFLYVKNGWTIKATDDGRLKVSRFLANEEDRHQTCERTVDQLVRTLAELGGTYEDVIDVLLAAQQDGCLEARVAVDALPRMGRRFAVPDEPSAEEDDTAEPVWRGIALPELFQIQLGAWDDRRVSPAEAVQTDDSAAPERGIFDRMFGWMGQSR